METSVKIYKGKYIYYVDCQICNMLHLVTQLLTLGHEHCKFNIKEAHH